MNQGGRHISGPKPDWDNVPKKDRNVFQNIAAATDGWVTPANVLDRVCDVLTISATIDIHKGKSAWKPLAKLAISATADLVNGWMAEKTRTKCSKGKYSDAFSDKLRVTLGCAAYMQKDVIPKKVSVPIIASQAAITAGAFIAHKKDKDEIIQPGQSGRLTMFDLNTGLGLMILSDALERSSHEKEADYAHLGADTMLGFMKGESIRTASDYSKRLFSAVNKS